MSISSKTLYLHGAQMPSHVPEGERVLSEVHRSQDMGPKAASVFICSYRMPVRLHLCSFSESVGETPSESTSLMACCGSEIALRYETARGVSAESHSQSNARLSRSAHSCRGEWPTAFLGRHAQITFEHRGGMETGLMSCVFQITSFSTKMQTSGRKVLGSNRV